MPPGQKSNVEVAIRIRPLRKDIGETTANWEVQKKLIIERPNPDNRFTFDRIYDQDSTTTDLYQNSVKNTIVQNVSKGYNGTVFAYGQTGSGKSFTMLGDGLEGKNDAIVNMSIRDLFSALEKDKKEQERDGSVKVQINVYVAMLEIYNEQLRDLLVPPGADVLPLAIRENEHGVYVHNAIRRHVNTARECLEVIYNEAVARRVSAATSMNDQSSRSHCLIRVLVEKTIRYEDDSDESSDGEEMGNIGTNEKKIVSSLNLVDLAGSERVAKTGATGQRMVEGGHINKSLTILTTVINRLTEENTKAVTHVPYRDSKLTHLLKTALGGNSLTAVFCCMTVAQEHTDESRSTLQFASRAKTIRNQVQMNEVTDHKTKLREVELELKRCKKLLVATTIYLWSKDVKIKNLKSGVPNNSSSVSEGRGTSSQQGGHIITSEGEVVDASQVQQMQILIEQLTDQNEQLQEELSEALRHQKSKGNAADYVDPMLGVADDEEKRQLKEDVEALQAMLEESELELKQVKESLEELELVVEELEVEVEDKESEIIGLKKKMRELEVKSKSFANFESEYKVQIEQLQQQIQRKDAETMEKVKGSDDTLEEMTKLHMEHETLRFEYNELQSLHSRSEIEHKSKIELLNDRIDEVQKDIEKEKHSTKLSNSYCWRVLNVAHLAVHGKPLETDTNTDLTAPIREHQIDQAVKALTSFVNSRSSKPPSVIGNSPSRAQVSVNGTPTEKEGSEKKSDKGHTNSFKNEDEYKKKIVELEKVILTKDAQRDIIIDTKLKRLQELVLRLQTTNLALCTEVKNVVRENHNLFEIIKKDPKLTRSLNKTNLQLLVEDEIMLRALTAPVPQRPFGHN
eukprot:Tbor_TRINITY_DN2807_c0_g1::TRINITY_DN2807_c0_g1_i1::g.23202::m.23202/K11498/CENPE; centromeric protein E